MSSEPGHALQGALCQRWRAGGGGRTAQALVEQVDAQQADHDLGKHIAAAKENAEHRGHEADRERPQVRRRGARGRRRLAPPAATAGLLGRRRRAGGAAAAVVGVDTETNEILDLNREEPGQLIELEGQNPNALVADFANDRLIVLHTGCYHPGATEEDEPTRDHRGIEAVSLSSGSSEWLYESAEAERLSYLLWLGPERAYVGQGFPTVWHAWNPTEPALGAVESKIPELAAWDGKRIVGVAAAEDGSIDAVAFDPDSGEVATVASGLFQTEGLFSYGSAVLP